MTVVYTVPQTSLLDWDFLMTVHKPKRNLKVISFFANVGAAAVSDPGVLHMVRTSEAADVSCHWSVV